MEIKTRINKIYLSAKNAYLLDRAAEAAISQLQPLFI